MKFRVPRQEIKGLMFVSPWIIGLLWFYIYPFFSSFFYSLRSATALSAGSFIGLRNYQFMLRDSLFWKSLYNTICFTGSSVLLSTVLSLGLALLIPKRNPAATFFRSVFYLPMVVPFTGVSVLWIWILHPRYGLLNHALDAVGLPSPGWLSDPRWAMTGLVLVSLWSIGNMMVVYLAAVMDIPADMHEAAMLDGASWLQRTLYLTIPMLTPVILFNLIIGLIGGFQYFVQPYVMTNGGPADSTLVYSLYLYRNAFQFFRMGYASAMGWVLFLLMLVLTLLLFRSAKRWVHYRM